MIEIFYDSEYKLLVYTKSTLISPLRECFFKMEFWIKWSPDNRAHHAIKPERLHLINSTKHSLRGELNVLLVYTRSLYSES
jgi:hypothetical protein